MMSVITGLKAGKRREKRVNVFLDGSFAFSLEAEVVQQAALRVGQELSPDQEAALAGADRYQRCLNAASRFLAYRPRSEAEVRERLGKHGYDTATIEKTVSRLRDIKLVDDVDFARFWTENREEFSPRGRRVLRMELRRKGLDADTIDAAIGGITEEESAGRAARKKARSLPLDDYDAFRRRLGDYLARRGFGYEICQKTTERMWKEYRQDRE